MKSLIKLNALPLTVLIGITFLLISITNHHILTLDFFRRNHELLSGVPGDELKIYTGLQKWIYLSSALFLTGKICAIAILISTAMYLNDISISFKRVLLVVTIAEYVFLIPAVYKIVWFYYYCLQCDINAWYDHYLLSALSLFPGSGTDWHYLLQTLNLFEVAYWFILALGLHKIANISYDSALRTVMISYLPALAIWMVTITFIFLLLFPS